MSILSRLRLLYLGYLSKPASDRLVYRAIRRNRPRKIVELDIADATRAQRMIEVAQRASGQEVHYVGMDLFEGREVSQDGPGLSLKAAHRLLCGTGAKVQLLPGSPPESLARMANALGQVDLLIIPRRFDGPDFRRMWFFVPRMLHQRSLVFVEAAASDGQRILRLKPRREIEQLASLGENRRAA